jgi:hypothetical protein
VTLITCQHCDADIDVAKDPRCVVYDPSGSTDVICEGCREQQRARAVDWPPNLNAQLIKRGWRA